MMSREWLCVLSKDRDYLDLTDLSEEYHLKLETWLKDESIRGLLKYLEEKKLRPLRIRCGHYMLRVELLYTILTPTFMTALTPSVNADMTKILVDNMLAYTKSRRNVEFFYVEPSEPEKLANAKVSTIAKMYHKAREEFEGEKVTQFGGDRTRMLSLFYETQILSSMYRMALASLMINEANRIYEQRNGDIILRQDAKMMGVEL